MPAILCYGGEVESGRQGPRIMFKAKDIKQTWQKCMARAQKSVCAHATVAETDFEFQPHSTQL